MAGSRTVTLNVIGDSSGAQKALKDVGDHAEGAAKRAHGAFTGVLGMLNSTGVLGPFGEALNKITESFDTIGEHGKAAGAKLMAIGGAGLGIGGMMTAIGDKDKAASQQLRASVEAIGESWDDAKDGLESNIKFAEKYGDSAKTTQDALSILTTGLHSSKKATEDFGVVLDLAAKRHEGLTQAATDWIKINEGKGTKILATLGLSHANTAKDIKAMESAQKNATAADDAAAKAKQHLADVIDLQHTKTKLTEADHIALRNAQDAVTVANEKAAAAHDKLSRSQQVNAAAAAQMSDMTRVSIATAGQADAQANTFSGHVKALTVHFEDQAAQLGQKYGPALMGVSSGIGILGGGVEAVSAIMGKFKTANEAATVATEGLSAAEDAEAASSGLALGPILLIVGAVAAVGVAIYELWTHWNTVWGWIKGVIADAWKWVNDHIVLVAALFLPGAVLIKAIDFLHDHWAGIWNGIKDVINAVWSVIKPVIDTMTGAIRAVSGPIGDVINVAAKAGGAVGGAIAHVLGFAEGGMVPGPVGTPVLAVVHGGETVIPVGGSTTTVGSMTFNINGARDTGAIRDEILRIIRRNIGGGLA